MKSLSRREPSFGSLLRYIARERAGERRKRTRVILLHNLRTDVPDLTMVEGEFVENAKYLPAQRNGVALYHEILSLSREDASKVTPAMLQDLAQRYLDLRAPRSLAYGEAHWTTGTPHVHLMISGNEVESSRKTRLSKDELVRVKQKLERYQRERYPELERSQVEHGRGHDHGRPRGREQGTAEAERERRLRQQGRGEPSRKEVLAELVTRLLVKAMSEEDFLRRLFEQGLRPYRRGQSLGIQDAETGRRVRLTTLGVGESYAEAFRAWERQDGRARELERIELGRTRQLVRELGFREKVRAVIYVRDQVRFESLHALPKRR